jgi:hypothetical protein
MPTVCNYKQLIGKFDKFDSPEKNQGIGLYLLMWIFKCVYIW